MDLETLEDSTLTLLTSDGAQLAENDDFGSGLSWYLEWTAPSSGTYKIVVGGYDQEVGTFLLTVASSQAGQNDPCDGGVTLTEDSGDIFFSNQYETVRCHDIARSHREMHLSCILLKMAAISLLTGGDLRLDDRVQ